SLLLWTPINQSSVFSPERMMVGGGLIGCIAAFCLGSARQREVAFGIGFAEAVLIAVGVSNHWLNFWVGPSIWYYESYLFPYFTLFISFLLLFPFTLAWRLAGPALLATLQQRLVTFANVTAALALPLAIGLYARAVGPAVAAASRANPTFSIASPLPQAETAITRILKSEITLSPDQSFPGRVAVRTAR